MRVARSVCWPAGTAVMVYRPSGPESAPEPDTLTLTPERGAPASLVTTPVTVPVACASAWGARHNEASRLTSSAFRISCPPGRGVGAWAARPQGALARQD